MMTFKRAASLFRSFFFLFFLALLLPLTTFAQSEPIYQAPDGISVAPTFQPPGSPNFSCGTTNLELKPSPDGVSFEASFSLGRSDINRALPSSYVFVSTFTYQAGRIQAVGYTGADLYAKLLPPPHDGFVLTPTEAPGVNLLSYVGPAKTTYKLRGLLPGARYSLFISAPLISTQNPPPDPPLGCFNEVYVAIPPEAVCNVNCQKASLSFDGRLGQCVYPCLGTLGGGVCAPSGAAGMYSTDDIDFSEQVGPSVGGAEAAVQVENQILHQQVPITGSALSLHYSSDRQPGRALSRTVTIPLTTDPLPTGLSSISIAISVAGQSKTINITTGIIPSMAYPFTWDGKNGSGQPVSGGQTLSATVTLKNGGGSTISTKSYKMQVTSQNINAGALAPAVAGWTLSNHHVIDGCYLYLGTGAKLKYTGVNPGFSGTGEGVIASQDGSELYVFSSANRRHLRTVASATGTVMTTFTYDANGRLSATSDPFGNTLAVTRATNGNPTILTAPFGQLTTLTTDANGYLASVANPVGEKYLMSHTGNGLLQTFTNPNGNKSTFTYAGNGESLERVSRQPKRGKVSSWASHLHQRVDDQWQEDPRGDRPRWA